MRARSEHQGAAARRARRWAGVLAILLLLGSGCAARLKRDLAPVPSAGCPHESFSEYARQSNGFADSPDSRLLSCALAAFRAEPVVAANGGSVLGSKLCLRLADRTTDKATKKRLAAEGVRYAEAALQAGARGEGEAHYYLAVNLGLAVRDDVTAALGSLKRIVEHLEQAVALSPGIDDGGPYRVLGMVYLMAPAWPQGIGDGDRAVELLERAVAAFPKHPLNQAFLAQSLWEVEGRSRRQQVVEHLTRSLELLADPRWGEDAVGWRALVGEIAADAGVEPTPGIGAGGPVSGRSNATGAWVPPPRECYEGAPAARAVCGATSAKPSCSGGAAT